MIRASPACAALAVAVPSLAQTPPTFDQLLDRMGTYLVEYESHLSRIVADERFQQNTFAANSEYRRAGVTLESEIASSGCPAARSGWDSVTCGA